jgi:hypothetical protein
MPSKAESVPSKIWTATPVMRRSKGLRRESLLAQFCVGDYGRIPRDTDAIL